VKNKTLLYGQLQERIHSMSLQRNLLPRLLSQNYFLTALETSLK
jgi:hypothetical protein